MGTSSYVLVGTQQAMEQTFGSTCHGAGRAMSRAQSKKTLGYKEVCSTTSVFTRMHSGRVPQLCKSGPLSMSTPLVSWHVLMETAIIVVDVLIQQVGIQHTLSCVHVMYLFYSVQF